MADDSYIIPVKTNSAESLTFECVTHFVDLSKPTEDPMPWEFVLHMVEVENESLIQHDIIYFQHTEKYPLHDAVAASSPPRARRSSSRR
jgi:hypothetical protein